MVELLIDLSDSDMYLDIESLFLKQLKSYPEMMRDLLFECTNKGGRVLLSKLFAVLLQDSLGLMNDI